MDEPVQSRGGTGLDAIRDAWHSECFACQNHPSPGLHLRCELRPDGSVQACFIPSAWMQGYAGRLHGGIIAAVLDSAMTQCLFAHSIVAVTGNLKARFLAPATLSMQYLVSARIVERRHSAYQLRAEIHSQDTLIATAEALFVDMPEHTAIQQT